MMLDDFFTLTEINNGLTVPSRVKELVAVMQNDRDSVVKNVGEATRQWSAVATAISATENQECLDLFIQLDGLHFFGKWINDAQRFSNDSSDGFLEETIIHLLQALGKLQVHCKKKVAAEILTTVKDLLVHNSSKVKDKAQVLLESWKNKRDYDESLSDVEKIGALTDDDAGKGANIGTGNELSEFSEKDDSLPKETSCNEEITREDPVLSISSDAVHPCQVEKTNNSDKVFDPSIGDDAPSGHGSSPSLPKPAMELPLCHSVDATSVEPCNPDISRENTLDGQMEFQELESASNIKHTPNAPDKSGSIKEFNTSEDRTFHASSDAGDATKSLTHFNSKKLNVVGNKSSSDEGSLCIDSRKSDSDGKCSMDDRVSADECKNSSAFTTEEGGEYHKLFRSSSSEKTWKNIEFEPSQSENKDQGNIKKLDLLVRSDNVANDYVAKKETRREPDLACKKSDVELYGIIDPLEVARQVAIEVERELVGYRERSCSSSEKLSESNVEQQGSPDSLSGNQSHASESSPKDVSNDRDLSAEASPMQEESATSTENAEQTNGMQDMETSQVTEAAPEEANTERSPCNFDLNQEVCSEDADHSMNQLLTSASIVSASRAAAPPGLPVAPLQFEGNLGWKGSAATSAFRPASSRRLSESEKDLSTGGSSSNSKQQERCLDIDLNVAEVIDGRTECPSPNKNIPLYTGLSYGESSMESNPRRSERLDLDLNLASEDGARTSDWRIGQFLPQGNSLQNHSHSSSSPSKQPPLKNFDLNDRPSFLNGSSDTSYMNKLSQSFNVSEGIKSNDSVISIMGTRVEVSRNDLVSPISALPNGRTSSEHAFDVNLGRTGSFLGMGSVIPYTHSSVYGYHNIAPGPATPFSSPMYSSGGPFPYMMDSRGSTVITQIIGSSSAFPTSFSQTPFFINMTNPTPSNGVGPVGPSRSSFDLNSGTMVESGSRETTGLFLNSGRVRLMDEQLGSNAQTTINSLANGKRKEPEDGWEQYPHRHFTPSPWK